MIPQITQLVEESWWNVTKYKYFVTLLKYIFHVSLLYLSKINRAYLLLLHYILQQLFYFLLHYISTTSVTFSLHFLIV